MQLFMPFQEKRGRGECCLRDASAGAGVVPRKAERRQPPETQARGEVAACVPMSAASVCYMHVRLQPSSAHVRTEGRKEM